MEFNAIDLTVLIPVHNEAGNILPLADEIAAALGTLCDFEVLFIDDGSTDATADELVQAMARHGNVRAVRHDRRSGKSRALLTGFALAKGRWIQTLDGDRQNDPKDAALLWRQLQNPLPPKNLGIVAGIRKRRNDGLVKFVSSRLANWTRRLLLNDPTVDTACGFKLIRADAARELPYFDGMHRFMPALIRRQGLETMQIPIEDRPRAAGVSKYGFFGRLTAGIFDLLGVLWLIRRSHRTGFSEIKSGQRGQT